MSQQANWFKVQQDLIRKDLIAEFEVETITYTRIGSYKATPFSYDLNLLNKNIVKSLKGVWRWWARVAITGAYNGTRDYEEAHKHLCKIFGGSKEYKGTSLYQLETSLLNLNNMNLNKWKEYINKKINDIYNKSKSKKYLLKELEKDDDLSTFVSIPRIKLLLMPRKDEEDERYLKRIKEEFFTIITKGIKINIKIYGDKDKNKAKFAISTFILSLLLGGIGSLTKRGFGSLKILNYKIHEKVKDNDVIEIINNLKDKSQINEENLKDNLNKLIYLAVDSARKLFRIESSDKVNIPKVPSLMSNTEFFKIEIKELKGDKKVDEILKEIGEAFLKQKWKAGIPDGKFHTWILGLPRYVGKTGYLKKEKDGNLSGNIRRVSSIAVRLYENNNKFFLIFYGFLSQDWPLKNLYYQKSEKGKPLLVKHISVIDPTDLTQKIPPIPREDDFLKKIFNIAFNTIIKKFEKI
jgi:CRISPR type III-B/RAMP module RAMP protein Cmr1